MEDEDPDSDDLFFTSTLLIIDLVNGSELICSGVTASGTVYQGNITVVLSGECWKVISLIPSYIVLNFNCSLQAHQTLLLMWVMMRVL